MRDRNPFSGPGQGPYWNGSPPRLGLLHGFFHNLCTAVCSCVHVFCCCWLLEECCMGRRRFPGPSFGSPEPLPPPPIVPTVGPRPHGLMGPPVPVVHTSHKASPY
ncbi:hypothetical protein CDL12_11310 [Handroanthus impetiginosus]|uniref:Uncharacterized protein n=1 Tax=Handroanthus impetiginosus TaxID=429701 RepID=A0A2G9HEU6_9LAMI|nr:hypothetical protein CDL12_11310 [Handroanthus impetiginosus]